MSTPSLESGDYYMKTYRDSDDIDDAVRVERRTVDDGGDESQYTIAVLETETLADAVMNHVMVTGTYELDVWYGPC